ncbi:tRNA (adenine22-N1)-methyltransferase [Lacrimispora xylanisolvens]|uniref:tRNA (Adenine22-N1)-methyltransferase n=1 Tax=Lacrimispora xylanisolvens TaxID=384636 RepID=A0A2S6HRN2_9FIRM|nr:class I SAM-dependent methyltransferase [Hungatella xylanolytica]PPK80259.1 tRNA (adenine22-N1)-methyltransferase [Hungatella xylanolytica]
MKLSKRLGMIASFVPGGSRVADIGTDHGYIPIHLVQEGIAKSAIAMDVRKGPLLRAQTHIKEAGLTDLVEVRLSDGLLKLEKNQADCVVIAGMGGELIIHILEEGRHLWDSISYWVLSPHSELYKVRKFLAEHEFSIRRETMIKEDGKYYSVMGVTRDSMVSEDRDPELGYRYGKDLLDSKNPVLKEFLQKEQIQIGEILKGLQSSGTKNAEGRIEELKLELKWNKEAQDAMQQTD